MRLSLLVAALVAAATPLAAQQHPEHPQTPFGAVVRDTPQLTRADTAAILRAATDSVWRYIGGSVIVSGDTAWVPVTRSTATFRRDSTGSSDEMGVGFTQATRRVERHGGRWVRRPTP